MEKTKENTVRCFELVNSMKVLVRDQPREPEVMQMSVEALTGTLLGACTRLDIAEEIVAEIIESEERWPCPAILRRYLRSSDYVEEDRSRRHREQFRKDVEERKRREGETQCREMASSPLEESILASLRTTSRT